MERIFSLLCSFFTTFGMKQDPLHFITSAAVESGAFTLQYVLCESSHV